MKSICRLSPVALASGLALLFCAGAIGADRVITANGIVEGVVNPDTGIRIFKGIPYAQPPVGDLRWKEPQPAANWEGVRAAVQFGPRCMQRPSSGYDFRSTDMSEDCLYLNVWTPARSAGERLPVLVYFYGGGFRFGDGSEARYDGESMARKGMVAVTLNYRLGVLGFLAHPELTRESPHHVSGNYGLLDQNAALRWVARDIAAFGGDPKKVTIAGESAGSMAVSAQMASPLSKDMIAGAIGESGAMVAEVMLPLTQAEQDGSRLAASLGAASLVGLRAVPANRVQQEAAIPGRGAFWLIQDGYFFPLSPAAIFGAGKQAHVPLLAGWNSEESGQQGVLGRDEPTPENYRKAIGRLYKEEAEAVLKRYPGATQDEVVQAATDLAGDRFIAFGTWKWIDLCAKTGGQPVYRYLYTRSRPARLPGADANALVPPPARGAVHSAEIEYAMGNLSTHQVYDWTADDYKVSKLMQGYFANFVKTGNPNGPGLPEWPALNGEAGAKVMRLDVESKAEGEQHRDRYLLLDEFFMKAAK